VFRIRKEQLDAFSRELESRFVLRLVRHLREDLPGEVAAQGLQEQDLEPLVMRGVEDAKRYGVVNEGDLRRYIECLAVLGPRFDTDGKFPWAGEALRRTDIDGEAKMDAIDEHLIFGVGWGR
jgi:hypothetical protein